MGLTGRASETKGAGSISKPQAGPSNLKQGPFLLPAS